jgi:adenosylmethionine-8-amino-7-oxononanoate aminotransferase
LGRLLADLAADTPGVGNIRRLGFIVGLDVVNREGQAFPTEERFGLRVCAEARRFGLLTRNIGDTVVLMPPYCTTPAELAEMVQALRSALRTLLD